MPRLPTYDGPQVLTEPGRPAFRRNVDVSSGAESLARALGGVGEVIDRRLERDAEIKANEIETRLYGEWLQADAELRQKYRGVDADGYTPAATDWWNQAKERFGKDIDERVARRIGPVLARRAAMALGNGAQYVDQEKERHADALVSAQVTNQASIAITTGDVVGARQRVLDVVREQAARKRWSSEQLQAAQRENLSSMHVAVVQQLVEGGKAADADKYLTANRSEIAPTALPRVEAAVKGEVDNQYAQRFVLENADKPITEQLKLAGAETDPARREKVVTAIRTQQALIAAGRREVEEAAGKKAWQLFAQGKPVPETVLSEMDGRERVQLQEQQRMRIERLTAGAAVKTNWEVYLDLRDQVRRGQPVNLNAYRESLAPAQLEQIADLQDAQAKGANKLGTRDVVTFEAQLGAMGAELGLKGDRLGRFKARAQDLILEHTRRHGKPPTDDERAELLRWLGGKVVTENAFLWFDTTSDRFSRPRDEILRDAPIAPPTAPGGTKFVIGNVYVDGQGRRATYGGVDAAGNPIWKPAQ